MYSFVLSAAHNMVHVAMVLCFWITMFCEDISYKQIVRVGELILTVGIGLALYAVMVLNNKLVLIEIST